MTGNNSDIVENRSEIVFLYDAVDANPNGNPLSGANRPRIDPQTQQCIVTDVRLKRYLRDQLDADGHGVYIRNVNKNGTQYTREQLLADRICELNLDELSDEALADEVFGTFLENSTDVRYFGATLSVDADDRIRTALPNHFTGPVQFSPGKSLHAVNENEGYNSLTSVIATGEDKEQGGYDLDDHRVQYALIAFHGLVDEHGAVDTRLTAADVYRLDTLCWRALKDQTISRSKVGQEPRLYLRVEYEGESYHIGGLSDDLKIDSEHSKPDDELRNIRDLHLDVSPLVGRLAAHADRVKRVRTVASDVLQISHNDVVGGPEFLYDTLREAIGEHAVEVIDVYNEHSETLPAGE